MAKPTKKASFHDCHGDEVRVKQRVWSTQSYRLGQVIQGEVIRRLEERPDVIEVRHLTGPDTGRAFTSASFLWSLKPTKPGPEPRLVKKVCRCCGGSGEVEELELPPKPFSDSVV